MSTELDRVTAEVCAELGVPISLVTLVEADRQVFLGETGLEGQWAEDRATPLSHSFCQYVAADREPLVIKDARLAPRVSDNPSVELGVIAYAGVPLISSDGEALGALCAIDSEPRDWSEEDLAKLATLADRVMGLIE